MFQCISYNLLVGNSQELHLAVWHSICGEILSMGRFQASELDRQQWKVSKRVIDNSRKRNRPIHLFYVDHAYYFGISF